jgi:ABC-type polar amino acid transport system ATPase subunit
MIKLAKENITMVVVTHEIFDNRDICIDSGKFGADTSADILCGVVRSVFD